MSGPYDREDLFWDNFGDRWWNEERENWFPENYRGLTQNQQILVNAASVAHQGGNPRCYPCDEEDVVEVARTPTLQPPLPKVSIRRAGNDIIHYNSTPRELSSTERETMRRLRLKLFDRVSFRMEDLPGLVIRAFKDIDCMLFGSCLLGRVHVKWAGPSAMMEAYPEHDSANTRLRGLCTAKSWGARIDLCIEGLLITPDGEDLFAVFHSVLVTLLHEMVVSPLLAVGLSFGIER